MVLKDTDAGEIDIIVKKQKNFQNSKASGDISFRRKMLLRLREGLQKHEAAIASALEHDLNKTYAEAYLTEFGMVYNEISLHLRHLRKWSRKRKVRTPLTLFPSKSYIVKEPLGHVLIVSPWNYPVQLLLNPLVGALSAGCSALLKPSPYVPEVSAAIENMIKDTFDEEVVAIVQGGREVNTILFNTRFDLIFLTGSPALGKVAMKAAAEHLTPVILELGGKSPCIVDKSADLAVAARRIVWGKTINSGQTCIAPDYVLVQEDIKQMFIDKCLESLAENVEDRDFLTCMVRDEAIERVASYFKDGELVCGGDVCMDAKTISFTIMDNVSPDSPVMQEEIFGPVLPVLTYHRIEDAISFVNSREKPLALYYFGNEKVGDRVVSETSSGGVCINDTIMHIANENLPFGGVGNSGMGNYHGYRSFQAFTHEKAVVVSSIGLDLPFRYQPSLFLDFIKRLLGGRR